MRPQGEIRTCLMRGLEAGRGTTKDLALRTGVGVTAAMKTLDNMVRAGHATVVDQVRVPGVKRPVPVYGPAADEPAGNGTNWDLIVCWAQWPTNR